ncbi:type II toxin-antitoxin system RelE/ParE family toxin [Pseudidiomarina marina]|uniref:type II toxin-antitoxin system RelE/ParE family toxin n=1 Tax=Pseudidiomarina marina TaxID=502366 RepID=UPI0038505334
MAYKLSSLAAEDFAEIYEYTLVNFGELHAQSYLLDLEKIMDLLVSSPMIGYECDDISEGVRRFNHNHHALFYRIIKKDNLSSDVVIVRILHQQMNPHLYFPS